MSRLGALFDTSRSDTRRVGLGLATATAVISGFAVFLNGMAVKSFADPIVYTTMKNGVAAAILVGLALVVTRGAVGTPRRALPGLIVLGIVGGSIPFVLFFTGLAEATAPAAAFIHKTLFIWVAVLAVLFLRERIGWLQAAALGILLVAQLLIQTPAGVGFGAGEVLIALATGLWAIEAVVARRLLPGVGTPVAAAARMGIGLVILAAFVTASGRLGAVATMGAEQWMWILITGVVLAGYVATWYAALRRAPASAVTAVLTLGAPITAGLQLVGAGRAPDPAAVGGYVLVVIAVAAVWVLVTRSKAGARPAGAGSG